MAIAVRVQQPPACLREEYVLPKSYDALTCLARFSLKIRLWTTRRRTYIVTKALAALSALKLCHPLHTNDT